MPALSLRVREDHFVAPVVQSVLCVCVCQWSDYSSRTKRPLTCMFDLVVIYVKFVGQGHGSQEEMFLFSAENEVDLGNTSSGNVASIYNKSSAVAEMGDRGHNRHGPKRGGVLCPFRGALGTRLIQCGLRGGLYFRSKWRLHPSSRLATIV